MIRKIVAVLIGVVAGSAFNMAMVSVSHAMYPLPEGIDFAVADVLLYVPAALLGVMLGGALTGRSFCKTQ